MRKLSQRWMGEGCRVGIWKDVPNPVPRSTVADPGSCTQLFSEVAAMSHTGIRKTGAGALVVVGVLIGVTLLRIFFGGSSNVGSFVIRGHDLARCDAAMPTELRLPMLPNDCDSAVGDELLVRWRRTQCVVCRAHAHPAFGKEQRDARVELYRIPGYSGEPRAIVHRNVAVTQAALFRPERFQKFCEGMLPPDAEPQPMAIAPVPQRKTHPHKRRLVFRLRRRDVNDGFAMFQAYLTAFATAEMLNVSLTRACVVLMDAYETPADDYDMWLALVGKRRGRVWAGFYSNAALGIDKDDVDPGEDDESIDISRGVLVGTLVDVPNLATASLLTATAGPLVGVLQTTVCRGSALVRRFVAATLQHLHDPKTIQHQRRSQAFEDGGAKHTAVLAVPDGRFVYADEDVFVKALDKAVGANIHVKPFDLRRNAGESAHSVRNSCALIARNGDLAWGLYLPANRSTLVQVIGEDDLVDRRYANVAQLAGAAYDSIAFRARGEAGSMPAGGTPQPQIHVAKEAHELPWTAQDLERLANLVRRACA